VTERRAWGHVCVVVDRAHVAIKKIRGRKGRKGRRGRKGIHAVCCFFGGDGEKRNRIDDDDDDASMLRCPFRASHVTSDYRRTLFRSVAPILRSVAPIQLTLRDSITLRLQPFANG
jgi:hypothetical protein